MRVCCTRRACLAGYYCAGLATINPTPCGSGVYCPTGSNRPLPCPLGTFSSDVQLSNQTQCAPCPAGSYCSDIGISEPSGNCTAGYYCKGLTTTATPINLATGDICPVRLVTVHYRAIG